MRLLVSIVMTAACALPPAAGAELDQADVNGAVRQGVTFILELQEGPTGAEWPYEGVYRVNGEIPIGYRVGGTAIAALALIEAPGYAEDRRRREAVNRALRFVVASIDEPGMSHDVTGRYDVRGWGYAYGLHFLLAMEQRAYCPDEIYGDVRRAIGFFIDGVEATSIPERGGWNYSRRRGFDEPGPSAPFMTGPTLQALFAARDRGYPVDARVVEQGLAALERARTETGAVVYSNGTRARRDAVPGSIGRMLAAETALYLAERSDAVRLRGALDAFLAHWQWLDDRRAQDGTHEEPYGVAPYYFYFAHYYAAQAIEMLPEYERDNYRAQLRRLLFSVRARNGSWNDRVFERSANFGTAMALRALVMPEVADRREGGGAKREPAAEPATPRRESD